jgi:hypothetical protein
VFVRISFKSILLEFRSNIAIKLSCEIPAQFRLTIAPPIVNELVNESNRSLNPSVLSRKLPKSKSPFPSFRPGSVRRLSDSNTVRPFPTTSRMPANPSKIRSSSSVSSRPAPFPGEGSSVRTARLRGGNDGRVKSTSVKDAGEGGMAVIVSVAEVAVAGVSDDVAARGRFAELE